MHPYLSSRAGERADDVRVCIAHDEQQLKEEQTSSPDGITATKPRQDVPAKDRLNLEKEKRSQKDGNREEEGLMWLAVTGISHPAYHIALYSHRSLAMLCWECSLRAILPLRSTTQYSKGVILH